MTGEQRRDLALEFAQHVADTYGFAVDTAIHAPSKVGSDLNHHAHLLMTTRSFDSDRESGWSKTKDRRFDAIAMQRGGSENEIETLREQWEIMQNRALERADIRDADGQPVRVDRRSYERQGLEIEPTRHEGPNATAIKRGGDHSDRAADNEEIRQHNAEREELAQQIEASRKAIAGEIGATRRTPDEDRLRHALHNSDPVQAIFADLDRAARPAYRGDGRFSAPRYTTAELSAFNEWLAAPEEDDRDRERGKGSREPRLLNTDPQQPDEYERQRTGPSYRR